MSKLVELSRTFLQPSRLSVVTVRYKSKKKKKSDTYQNIHYNPKPVHVQNLPPEKRAQWEWCSDTIMGYSSAQGQARLKRIMPQVLKIAKERRPKLFEVLNPENPPLNPKQDATLVQEGEKGAGKEIALSLAEEKKEMDKVDPMAKVPHFARYAEFRESHLNFEPSKLHVVWRNLAMAGRPMWEKAHMCDLNLHRPKQMMSVVKNTPAMNAKLWMIKHLLRIKPLTFPDGALTEENKKGMLLKPNGEFVQSKLYRDNYFRSVGRPELEQFVLLKNEKQEKMRRMYLRGSLDGSLLPHMSADGTANPTRDGGDLKKHFIPGSEKWK